MNRTTTLAITLLCLLTAACAVVTPPPAPAPPVPAPVIPPPAPTPPTPEAPLSPDDLILLARKALAAGDADGAQQFLRRASAAAPPERPDLPEALRTFQVERPLVEGHLARARGLEEAGDLPGARRHYAMAATIWPHFPPARDGRDRMALRSAALAEERYRQALAFLRKGDAESGRRHLLTALWLNPDHQEALEAVRSGAAQSSSVARPSPVSPEEPYPAPPPPTGQDEESIRRAEEAFSRRPDSREARETLAEACYQRGQALYRESAWEKALGSFRRAAELIPDHRDVREMIRRTGEALHEFVDTLYKEGIQFYRDQKLEEALGRWEEVLRLEPRHEGAQKYAEKARQLLQQLRTLDRP